MFKNFWSIASIAVSAYTLYMHVRDIANDKLTKDAIYNTLTPDQKALWDETFPPTTSVAASAAIPGAQVQNYQANVTTNTVPVTTVTSVATVH